MRTYTPDRSPEKFQRTLEAAKRFIEGPVPEFSTVNHADLVEYKRQAIRYAHCAPEGSILLTAPLQGWDGKPLGARTAQGPQTMLVNPAIRAAVQERHGEDPFERANRIWRANNEK